MYLKKDFIRKHNDSKLHRSINSNKKEGLGMIWAWVDGKYLFVSPALPMYNDLLVSKNHLASRSRIWKK